MAPSVAVTSRRSFASPRQAGEDLARDRFVAPNDLLGPILICPGEAGDLATQRINNPVFSAAEKKAFLAFRFVIPDPADFLR